MDKAQTVIVAASSEAGYIEVAAGQGTRMQVLIPADKSPHFSMRCFTITAGGGMPKHTNQVEHEQYVLQGSAEVGIGEDCYQVKVGDVLLIPAGVPHWYRNQGKESFKFLCLVPNKTDEIVIVDESVWPTRQ